MRAGAGVQRPSGTGDQRPAHAGRSQRGLTQRGPVDLAAIVGDVLGALQPDLQAPQLRVSASVGAAPALGDPSLTERMVVNLLGNAITHNVPGGWIDVITGVRDGRAWLTVANTGPAIPPAQVSRLFEPFRRLRPTVPAFMTAWASGCRSSRPSPARTTPTWRPRLGPAAGW
jgi:signal transduction histidine kinase